MMVAEDEISKTQIITDDYYKQSLDHFNCGRYSDASQLCKAIIQLNPSHIDAYNLMGVAAQKLNQHSKAVDLFKKTIAIDTDKAILYYNLGISLYSLGHLSEAIHNLQIAAGKEPDNAEIARELSLVVDANKQQEPDNKLLLSAQDVLQQGIDLHQSGRVDDAMTCYRQTLKLLPENSVALSNLGMILHTKGNLKEAIDCYQKATAIDPTLIDAHNNLGVALLDQKQFSEAVECYKQILSINQNSAEAHYNLGLAMKGQGHLEQAEASFRTAVSIDPEYAAAYNNLSIVLYKQNKLFAAEISCKKAVAIDPNYAEAYNNLGLILKFQGKFDTAVTAVKKALTIDPDFINGYINLGSILNAQGKANEAFELQQQIVAKIPGNILAHSNMLFTSHYFSDQSLETIFQSHIEWAKSCVQEDHITSVSFTNTLEPTRCLRVGYVSADFIHHPVGFLIGGVLQSHNDEKFKIFCYANNDKKDGITKRLKSYVDIWRTVSCLDDDALYELVIQDQIDILIDLSGHTAGHRLSLFNKRAAPIQITWIGYANTTGLRAMDYLIADDVVVPEGGGQKFTEEVVRLPHCYLNYPLPSYAPKVAEPPIVRKGYVTFGSCSTLAKINDNVVAIWSEILRRTPNGRLIIKNRSFKNLTAKERYKKKFTEHGISPDRIELLGPSLHAELLDFYGNFDIALAPIPYSGGVTTFEALWMGVPVIALNGADFSSRVSASILTGIGLPELAAKSSEEYIDIACTLATQPDTLRKLRTKMRSRLQTTPTGNPKLFTKSLEKTYRFLWNKWCSSSEAILDR
ncbi:MAG: tetratricopeptide repeat protein [Magnetococcales bacterium]|nr:tetratricopeptide repeat protein [Magnetococcales bacterium]